MNNIKSINEADNTTDRGWQQHWLYTNTVDNNNNTDSTLLRINAADNNILWHGWLER